MIRKRFSFLGYRISFILISKKRENVKTVLDDVSILYGVPVDDILGKRRLKLIVDARHDAMYRMRNDLRMTYSHIGLIFNRDHSTVIHAVEKVTNEKYIYG